LSVVTLSRLGIQTPVCRRSVVHSIPTSAIDTSPFLRHLFSFLSPEFPKVTTGYCSPTSPTHPPPSSRSPRAVCPDDLSYQDLRLCLGCLNWLRTEYFAPQLCYLFFSEFNASTPLSLWNPFVSLPQSFCDPSYSFHCVAFFSLSQSNVLVFLSYGGRTLRGADSFLLSPNELEASLGRRDFFSSLFSPPHSFELWR